MKNSRSYLDGQDKAPLDLSKGEISIADILRFLRGSWKAIIFFGLIGIALAIVYLAITPKQYEATVQIAVAQMINTSKNKNDQNWVNIEEPALLISRLSYPTSFTPETVVACGLQNQTNAALALSKSIKLTTAKGMVNVINLKTFGESQQVAHDCALEIFELIKTSQAQIVAPYIEEIKIKLADDQERLQKAQNFVVRSDNSGAAMSASYLSTRDEIYYLLDEIAALKNMAIGIQNRATRMVAPIYASDIHIAPKKHIALVVGLLSGLFLGLLIVLTQQIVLKLKSTTGSAL